MRRRITVGVCSTWALAALGWAGAGFAAEKAAAAPTRTYDLCARGLSNTPPKPPFTQTLRVKLTVSGPELDGDLIRPFAAQLIRASLWANKADQVFVEEYDATECAASAGSESTIEVTATQAEIDALRAEISRGDGVLTTVVALARKAGLSIDLASKDTEQAKLWLRVYYATNRSSSGSRATTQAFGQQRVDALSYGSVDVSVRKAPGMRDVESPAVFRFEKATDLDKFEAAVELVPLGRQEWQAELKRRASRFERPGVLLFIHGYNVPFADAARRSAQLAYDLAFPGPTVFFSWPSDAATIKYLHDGRDADNSAGAAATVLADVAGLLPGGPVYVVAHSMGNRVLVAGLARLLESDPGTRLAFKEIVLAAPDIDQESFRLNIAPKILDTGPRFTLYASRRDLALQTSQFIQGGKRLGFGGEVLYVTPGMDSVDASDVTKEFFGLNHSYFGDKNTVLSDLFHVIRGRLKAEERPNLRRITVPAGTAWAFK